MIDERTKERFWSKVDVRGKDECWEWQAALYSKNGYGVFWLEGKNHGAHRVSYMITNGEIKKGMFVCHKCDNKQCVNPDHLFLGTPVDNMRDMIQKGRRIISRNHENYIRGENHFLSKLTQRQVDTMRDLYKKKIKTTTGLSKMFGVSKSTTKKIISNKSWYDKNYIPQDLGWGIRKRNVFKG